MSILDVTTGATFSTVSDAIAGSGAGDVIQVPAGTYVENFPKITHDLTIEGVGGLASFMSPGGVPANGQGILVTDANVTLDHLELSGASASGGNGAGIRQESGNLVVADSWIHNNQDGLLTSGSLPGATLTITRSELNNNGAEDGFTHNLYVGQIGTLTVTDSYIHDAVGGHEIKSRADVNIITDNRIQDQGADSGYSIDLPNGGDATVTGNIFEKGKNAQQYTFVHFTGETVPDADSSLSLTDNTVINDSADAGGVPIFVRDQLTDALGNIYAPDILGNIFYGIGPDTLFLLPDGSFAPAADYVPDNQFLPLDAAPPLDTTAPFAVPEPGTAPLLTAALFLAALLRRRRARLIRARQAGAREAGRARSGPV